MEPLLDRLGRPLETLRISVTDRCNFRCVYCMPKEVFGREYAFLDRRSCSRSRRSRASRRVRALGVRPCGSPAASRSCAATSSTSSSCSRRSPTLELALTTNGAAARGEGGGARRRRAQPRHGEPRLARRRRVPRDERRRLPRAARPRGDRGGRRGRAAGEGERGRQARRERRRHRRAGRALPRHAATSFASSSTWTSGRRTAGGSRTSSRRTRSSRGSASAGRSTRRRRERRRDRPPLSLRRRRRRDRRDRVGHEAVLRRVLARAPLGRGQALHVPLRRPRPRPPRAAPQWRHRRRLADRSARSGRGAPTATPSSAPPKRALPKVEMSYIGG